MDLLLYKIFESVVNFKVDPVRFEQTKNSLKRAYINTRSDEPAQQIETYLKYIMSKKASSLKEKLESFNGNYIQLLSLYLDEYE